jgi:hypothetical protein
VVGGLAGCSLVLGYEEAPTELAGPECGDGRDNDGDGSTDVFDIGCFSPRVRLSPCSGGPGTEQVEVFGEPSAAEARWWVQGPERSETSGIALPPDARLTARRPIRSLSGDYEVRTTFRLPRGTALRVVFQDPATSIAAPDMNEPRGLFVDLERGADGAPDGLQTQVATDRFERQRDVDLGEASRLELSIRVGCRLRDRCGLLGLELTVADADTGELFVERRDVAVSQFVEAPGRLILWHRPAGTTAARVTLETLRLHTSPSSDCEVDGRVLAGALTGERPGDVRSDDRPLALASDGRASCALVSRANPADGVSALRRDDETANWRRMGDVALDGLATAASIRAGALAFDPSTQRYRALLLVDAGGVTRLWRASTADCADWSAWTVTSGPLSIPDPSSSRVEIPDTLSYVIRQRPSGSELVHEAFFSVDAPVTAGRLFFLASSDGDFAESSRQDYGATGLASPRVFQSGARDGLVVGTDPSTGRDGLVAWTVLPRSPRDTLGTTGQDPPARGVLFEPSVAGGAPPIPSDVLLAAVSDSATAPRWEALFAETAPDGTRRARQSCVGGFEPQGAVFDCPFDPLRTQYANRFCGDGLCDYESVSPLGVASCETDCGSILGAADALSKDPAPWRFDGRAGFAGGSRPVLVLQDGGAARDVSHRPPGVLIADVRLEADTPGTCSGGLWWSAGGESLAGLVFAREGNEWTLRASQGARTGSPATLEPNRWHRVQAAWGQDAIEVILRTMEGCELDRSIAPAPSVPSVTGVVAVADAGSECRILVENLAWVDDVGDIYEPGSACQ